jgi:CBS-domain-containing membrane protein
MELACRPPHPRSKLRRGWPRTARRKGHGPRAGTLLGVKERFELRCGPEISCAATSSRWLHLTGTLNVATDIMTIGRIRHLPVINDKGGFAGIVSQRDLFRAAISSVLGVGEGPQREWLGKVPVQAVMARHVITVGPEGSVTKAINRLLAGKFGCLPVVEGRQLVGLLTESDCLRCFRDMPKAGNFRELLS